MYQDLLPYFKSKLHSIYNREREARLQASLWGHVDERFDDIDTFGRGEDAVVSRGTSDMVVSVRTRLTKKIQKFIGAWYPLLHANREGLHALGIHVCRAAGQELVNVTLKRVTNGLSIVDLFMSHDIFFLCIYFSS